MSREYMVLLVETPTPDTNDIQGCKAEVFMRFTEEPTQDFLYRLSQQHPTKRIYSLMGASTWFSESE